MAVLGTATKRLLTRKELCEATGFSDWAILNFRKMGMPAIRIDRAVRFDLEDCIDWLKQNSQEISK
ncbi:MAG: hypothetical protein JKY95_11160 [Planctomycetaceae bacterium]|nr:hypothetical protein [Planctomycetaceae bacterium]